MPSHFVRRLLYLITLLVPIAMVPMATHAASALPARVIATTPLAAARAAVIGYYNPKYNMDTCSTELPMHRIAAWATCPFTIRFRQRLLQGGHANKGVELCGNQFPPRTVRLHMLATTGTTARVNAAWDFGPHISYSSTFVVVQRAGSWLVDNEYLSGKPGAGIYKEGRQSVCHG